MTIQQLVYYPNKLLREKSAPVVKDDADLAALVQDMKDTIQAHNAHGISAVQIGVLKCVVVIKQEDGEYKVLVNPLRNYLDTDKVTNTEGCLSFPGVQERITRDEDVTVVSCDETWNETTLAFDGIEAVAVQHEIDHLNGVLFTDYLKPLAKKFAIKKALKTKKKLRL